jgi:hypothetical protein
MYVTMVYHSGRSAPGSATLNSKKNSSEITAQTIAPDTKIGTEKGDLASDDFLATGFLLANAQQPK